MTAAEAATADTFPALLEHNAQIRGSRPAIREKDLGIWQTWTWRQVRDEVRVMASGFAALGLARGDKLVIVGDNRPQLYWAMVAAQALGAVPVPVYQDAAANEMQYVLEHAEARTEHTLDITAELFPLPTLAPRLAEVARDLIEGRGVALIRGVPVDTLGPERASAVYWEQNLTNQWILPGPGEHPIQLSPFGRGTEEFMACVDRLPDRGEPLTPVALLLSYGHGYERVNYHCKMLGHFTEDKNDLELRELFNVCWHPIVELEGKPITPDVQSMPGGVYGNVFDVLVDRPARAKANCGAGCRESR